MTLTPAVSRTVTVKLTLQLRLVPGTGAVSSVTDTVMEAREGGEGAVGLLSPPQARVKVRETMLVVSMITR